MDTKHNALNEQLQTFARNWVGRELDSEEQHQLAAFVSSLDAQEQQASQARTQARQVIDAGRHKIQAVIQQMLQGAESAVRQNAQSQLSAEEAALKSVEGAKTLSDLRPSALRPSQDGDTPGNQLLISQIADRLANMVKAEVDDCFDRQFSSLARQLQAVLDAAQASGLLASAQHDASDQAQEAKTAQKTHENAPAAGSQRDSGNVL